MVKADDNNGSTAISQIFFLDHVRKADANDAKGSCETELDVALAQMR